MGWLKKAFRNVTKTVGHVAGELMHTPVAIVGAVGKGTKAVLDETLGKAGKTLGDGVRGAEDLLDEVRDYATEHPFETALIIGGGFTGYVVFADLGSVTVSIITPAGAVGVLTWEAEKKKSEERERREEAKKGAQFVDENTPKTTVLDPSGPASAIEPGKTEGHEPFQDWPGTYMEFGFPTDTVELRDPTPNDPSGGLFLAPRDVNQGIARRHGGYDFLCDVAVPVYATLTGSIVRSVIPYPGNPKTPSGEAIMGLEIKNEFGFASRVFYVRPTDEIASALKNNETVHVKAGVTQIGISQDIAGYYAAKKKRVPEHVHVDWSDPSGRKISPDGRLAIEKPSKNEKEPK